MCRVAFLITQHNGEINFLVPFFFYLRSNGIEVDSYVCSELEDYGEYHHITKAIKDNYLGINELLKVEPVSSNLALKTLKQYDLVFVDHGVGIASDLAEQLPREKLRFHDHCIYIYLFYREMLLNPIFIHNNSRLCAPIIGYHSDSRKRFGLWGWQDFRPLGPYFLNSQFLEYSANRYAKTGLSNKNYLILYTRGWKEGYSPEVDTWMNFHIHLFSVANRLGYTVALRTHPAQIELQVNMLFRVAKESCDDLVNANNYDYFSVLSLPGIHVGLSSSAIIAPFAFGRRAILLWLPHQHKNFTDPTFTFAPNIPFADFNHMGLTTKVLNHPVDITVDMINEASSQSYMDYSQVSEPSILF